MIDPYFNSLAWTVQVAITVQFTDSKTWSFVARLSRFSNKFYTPTSVMLAVGSRYFSVRSPGIAHQNVFESLMRLTIATVEWQLSYPNHCLRQQKLSTKTWRFAFTYKIPSRLVVAKYCTCKCGTHRVVYLNSQLPELSNPSWRTLSLKIKRNSKA
jgi:hypothetical protein